MLLVIESFAMILLMLLVCVVGIADGPVGCVYFYEPEVQKRVIELGLITEEKLKKRKLIGALALFVPMLIFIPAMVYFVNGARGFLDCFVQILIILLIYGMFDRIFIDWFWVGKTGAWVIPGTEDLMPYVPKKTMIRKWIGTIIGFPILAALMAGVLAICGILRSS